MSAMKATGVTIAMFFAMLAVVTGLGANSNSQAHNNTANIVDGYGISSHVNR